MRTVSCWMRSSRRFIRVARADHHSDRGTQYLSIRYTERREAGIVSSVQHRRLVRQCAG